MKITKLSDNAQGISHYLVPLLIILGVAIFGTYRMVASHANAPCNVGYSQTSNGCVRDYSTSPGLTSPDIRNGGSSTQRDIQTQKARQTVAKQARDYAKKNKARSEDAASRASNSTPDSGPSTASSPSSGTGANVGGATVVETAPTASFTSIAPAPAPKPEGNIVIFTYVKNSDGSKNRLGTVKVKIAREGGNAKCLTHKGLSAKTNSKQKDSKGNLVKGTVHFNECAAGKYTVTAIGRSGYRILGDKTRTINLASDETDKVHFTLQKVTDKAKATGTSNVVR